MGSSQASEIISKWRKVISNEINSKKLVGNALVFFDGRETNCLLHGHTSLERNNPITMNTKFEIASLTKLFTGLVCAKLIIKKKISLNTTVGEFNWRISSDEIKNITIRELVTHTSGLPKLPINIRPSNPLNPYNDYTEVMLIEGFDGMKLNSKEYCYSNLGFAVLGKILSMAEGQEFKKQLSDIFQELGLTSTETLGSEDVHHLSDAHNEKLERVPHWHSNIFNSSGGVISTAQDLSKFCNLIISPSNTPLEEVISLSISKQFSSDTFGIGMGWHFYDNFKIFSHDGATYGNYAKIRVLPGERKFLISLSNTYNELNEIELTS